MSRRLFTMVEGTANKFWAIALDGASHTVEFGRIGTPGQSARKEFATDALAKSACDKLIAEKLKKGYVEQAGQSSVPSPVSTAAPAPAKTAQPRAKAKADETEVVVAEVPPAPVVEALTMPERTLGFDPADWARGPWRDRPPMILPEPEPFDLEAAKQRLRKIAESSRSYSSAWSEAKLTTNPSPEEARFWISMLDEYRNMTLRTSHVGRVQARIDRNEKLPSFVDLMQNLALIGHWVPEEILVAIYRSYPIEECLDAWDAPPGSPGYQIVWFNQKLIEAYRKHALPYLAADEVRSIREKVRAHLPPPAMPVQQTSGFPMAWYFAAMLGMHEEVATLVQIIPDNFYSPKNQYGTIYDSPQILVFGLGDPERIEAEWRRLNLRIVTPDDARTWLATTGYAALDVIRDFVLASTKKEDANAMMEVFGRVKAAEVAPMMLELVTSAKPPKNAGHWLESNLAFAISGLVATAAGKGKLADAAIEFLRGQNKKGRGDFLRQCLETAPPEVAEKVRREVLDHVQVELEPLDEASTPDDIKTALVESAKLKPPAWITPESLPKILVCSRAMTDSQITGLLAGLAKSTLEAPASIVRAVRLHADRASLDVFAWAVLERWNREGSPAKEKWAMGAIGLLGSDPSALKLTPLIRAWPGESQHARAVFGLECLRAIGTDGAMMRLNGIAQKVPFKGLKTKAAEMMEAIARDRKMTRAQLEDRIVPDCDLDDRGSRVFDFGPRQFTFVLGPEMKPMVRDPEGKLKPDLPKPGIKDDPAVSAASVEAWKLLKKQIKEVAKVQAERMEQAMVVGRRWTVDDFETLLVKHPLMTHLVRLVLWGGYDGENKLVSTFRLTEERDFADVNEKTVRLDRLAKVGIVHPLHLALGDSSAWGEIFGDYEIIPPFPQLGRPVHRIEPDEANLTDLHRKMTGKIPAVTLVGILERLDWTRGIPQDGGIFHNHSKGFEGADVTAVIQYTGVIVGYMLDSDEQEVENCFFVPGIHGTQSSPEHHKAIPLGKVDPVVLSEVLSTIGTLISKAT